MKQPRHVSLVSVHDYPRARYAAHWIIVVDGEDGLGYRAQANIVAYEPVAWDWQGKRTKERPDAPMPSYPPDLQLRQSDFLKMSREQKEKVKAQVDARRAKCSEIYEAHPKPRFDIAEEVFVADTRDEAETLAQTWVIEQMKGQLRPDAPANPQSGHAMVGMLTGGWVLEAMFDAVRRLLAPLVFALAYSTTIRNNRMNQVRDAIDGGAGAGLIRIYDGSRPASCGSATTLLAELTCSDPCAAGAASGVMTFSAITADASANATGTATWFRAVDSTGTCCVDGNVGTAGSDLNLNSTSISTGQEVSITSATITEGNA